MINRGTESSSPAPPEQEVEMKHQEDDVAKEILRQVDIAAKTVKEDPKPTPSNLISYDDSDEDQPEEAKEEYYNDLEELD